MIKRKEKIEYANSKLEQINKLIKNDKDYIYFSIIDSLTKCSFSIMENKLANIEAYKLSENAYSELMQFGYEEFLLNSLEGGLADTYITVLKWMKGFDHSISFNGLNPFYSNSRIDGIKYLLQEFVSKHKKTSLNNLLFQIEIYAENWKIDLHYVVDARLKNLEYYNNLFK